jgi:hypothetical protein
MAAFLALPAAAAAQDPAPGAEPATVLIGVEARRDRIRYHFDNPASVDTPFAVPHFFEQSYDAANLWLVATARYTAAVRWETSAGVTPRRSVRADDYDTFVDPGDVVIVAGTTGDASSQSLFISHRADVGHAGPVQLSLGYRLRWDRFDFGAGHKTVTRNGVLTAAADVTSPELTDSKVHEFLASFRAAPSLAGAWHLALSGEASPMTLARLSVQLPEKYPGQDLVFFAKVFAASGRLALVRAGRRWPIDLAVQIERSWSYRSTAQLSRPAESLALSAGWTW